MEAALSLTAHLRAWPPRACARRLGRTLGLDVLVLGAALAGAGCDGGENPLAPYEGERPLDLLKVTQSFTPEVQWVGGRVAAIGVNRGTRAALDSTLVWMMTAPDNSISSFVTIGERADEGVVLSYGGTPQDSLADGETYTFWLAERSAFEAGLDSTRMEPGTFADTTITMELLLRGLSAGGLDIEFEIERNERLTGEQFIVRWSPADVAFRRLAIRRVIGPGALGGFEGLIWHVLSPEEGPPLIASPVSIGVVPEGTIEVTPFSAEEGFGADTVFNPDGEFDPENEDEEGDVDPRIHVLWGVTDDWTGTFGLSAPGYAQFQIFACNFDLDEPCP